MNLIIIPFHDWRKIQDEGFRTRDSHIMEHLTKNKKVRKILIINRPTTKLELLLKNKSKINGELIFKTNNAHLYKINECLYVHDFVSNDYYGQIIKRRKWFSEKFRDKNFIESVITSANLLEMNPFNILSFNIFASGLIKNLNSRNKIFDAYDNILKFPAYRNIREHIRSNYMEYSNCIDKWTTNSEINKDYYNKCFDVKNCSVIRNGVDIARFSQASIIPIDLKHIKDPIIGFGGKITHLFNYTLFNYLSKNNPNFTFIIIGQIIDKNTYKKINKYSNVIYLGDKKYSEYPNYIKYFNVCIIPYNVGKKEHGGDAIKAYEYIAAGKPVVSTKITGIESLNNHIEIVESKEAFLNKIRKFVTMKSFVQTKIDNQHTWAYKTDQFLDTFC